MFLLTIYHEVIYRPLLNLLIFFYNIIPGHDIGIVIIVLTIVIRLILAPSFHKSLKSQKTMNDLQPKLNAVREKYKDDKEGQAKAMMELYKEHKINPLSSCLPVLIQLPILIALYQTFRIALGTGDIMGLYSFVQKPASISPYFLHLVDLSKVGYAGGHWYIPALILGLLAGATQFWQSKMMMPKTENSDPTARIMAMQTTYILPLFSIFISLRLPAGLPLYWIVTTLFAVGQQYYIIRQSKPTSV
jgi:YidC/Oxa1 family membrane protein insertase